MCSCLRPCREGLIGNNVCTVHILLSEYTLYVNLVPLNIILNTVFKVMLGWDVIRAMTY